MRPADILDGLSGDAVALWALCRWAREHGPAALVELADRLNTLTPNGDDAA